MSLPTPRHVTVVGPSYRPTPTLVAFERLARQAEAWNLTPAELLTRMPDGLQSTPSGVSALMP